MSLMAWRGSSDDEPPVEVKPVARFIDDLTYLTQLTQADTPPRQLYRAKHAAALFVIGNARLVVILDGSICNVWEFVLVQTYSLVESY